MLVTNSDLSPELPSVVFSVIPDELRVAIQIEGTANSPTVAFDRFDDVRLKVVEVAKGFTLVCERLRSMKERIVGKVRRVGEKHRVRVQGTLRASLEPSTDFFSRTRLLQSLYDALGPLDDGDTVKIGKELWCVANLEQHRRALLEATREQQAITQAVLGARPRPSGDLSKIEAVSVGPMRVDLRLGGALLLDTPSIRARVEAKREPS